MAIVLIIISLEVYRTLCRNIFNIAMNDILLLAFHKENESLEKFTIMQRSIATEEL